MNMKTLLLAPLALLLSGCSLATVGAGIATLRGSLSSVAAKIDQRVAIPAADLPAACRITAEISSAAQLLAQSGVLDAKHSDSLSTAANVASALSGSELCRDPSRNPIGLSLQLSDAISAVRATSSGHSAVTAAAVVAGAGSSNH